VLPPASVKWQAVAKPRHELWAECLREIGVLLLVFAPLEVVLRNERSVWWQWVVALVLLVAGLLMVEKGVRMESEK
jgi:hypothetical protein